MHKYNRLFFSVSFLIMSCSGNGAPNDIIDQVIMTNLLTDVHVLDGRLYSIQQNPDSLYKYGMGRYISLFKKFHTDSVHFRKSLQYYSTQPDQLLAIYDQVMANLKTKSDSLQKAQRNHHVVPKQ